MKLATAILCLHLAGCAQTLRSGSLIDHYNAADCIPRSNPAWTQEIQLRDNTRVSISANPGFSGHVGVRYPLDDRDVIAAEWGDYFRAIDIRFVRDESRLYTRVAGRPPAFGGSRVYLFEYDLERRRRSKVRVDDAALTEECPR